MKVVRGLSTEVGGVARSDQGNITARPNQPRPLEAEIPVADCSEYTLDTVEPPVIHVHHGIITQHARDEQISSVGRSGRHDNPESRDMREPGVQGLRVLWSLLPAAVDNASDGNRHGGLTSEHEAPFGRLRYDLVHGKQHEIDPGMNDDRPISAESGSYCRASAAKFRDRRVDNALAPKLLVETGHRGPHIPRAPQPLPDREHIGVAGHQIFKPCPYRCAVRFCHRAQV